MEEIIRQYFESVNNAETERTMALWDENGTFSAPLQRTLKGIDEVRTFYEAIPKKYREHEDRVVDYIQEGNKIAVRVRVDNITQDGRPLAFEAIDWITIENGKIASINAFFDSAKILQDLKK